MTGHLRRDIIKSLPSERNPLIFKGALSFNRRSALSAFFCASTACASYIITRRKIPSGVQLAIACCLIAVECCSYPLVTANWQMLALCTLFGFTYGLIMGAEVRCASMYSPPEMQFTAQALGCSLMLGVGRMISGALGSTLLNTMNAAAFIRMTALFTLPAALIFLLMARFAHKKKK